MSIKKTNIRISVILTREEWDYLNNTADWQQESMSKYMEKLLRKDMAECYSDNPRYLIDQIQNMLNNLKTKTDDLIVEEKV